MVQSPSSEAHWFAASQEIPRISRNPKVHYRTHKRPPPVSILGQPNPVHIPTSHLLEIRPNNTHKITTTIHTAKQQQLHTRQFKTSSNTHETSKNFTTCTKGKNTQARQFCVQFLVYKYERRRRFLSLVSALVWRFGTVPKLVENMSRVLEDHDRLLIGLGDQQWQWKFGLLQHTISRITMVMWLVLHMALLYSHVVFPLISCPRFSKAGTAMIIFHTDLLGSILKLRFTNKL